MKINSFYIHLKLVNQLLMKYAIYINNKIEELGKKAYQIIPQRNNFE